MNPPEDTVPTFDLDAELRSASLVASSPPRPYPEVNGFQALNEEDLIDRPPRPFLVADLIPVRSVIMLFGVPKTKKSFVAQDICNHISLGRPWAGREVLQGCTVFAAGERTDSLGGRLKAWREVHKPDGRIGIKYVEKVPDLMKLESVNSFIAALRHIETPISMVVLDTFARCTVGSEENSARDMQVAMTNADHIRDELDCAVMIVHHANRAGTGERGSGSLRAAVDVVLRIDAVGNDRVRVHLDASNDMPQCEDIVFEVVSAGPSCALRHFGSAPSASRQAVKAVSSQPTLFLLAELARESKDGRVERKSLVPHVAGATLTRHLREAIALGLLDQDDQDRYGLTAAGKALLTDDEVSLAA